MRAEARAGLECWEDRAAGAQTASLRTGAFRSGPSQRVNREAQKATGTGDEGMQMSEGGRDVRRKESHELLEMGIRRLSGSNWNSWVEHRPWREAGGLW